MSKTSVELIPWDPESPQHIERMVEQRKQCGWNSDKVEVAWRCAQMSGNQCLYWITIPSSNPGRDAQLKNHAARYPMDKEPLLDSAVALRGVPRTPTRASFRPVGHICLVAENPDVKALNLELPTENTFWIKTFYVSHALQSGGIGRAAMDQIESLATSEPLNARTLMLDTLLHENQTDKAIAEAFHGAVPKVSNQQWYARRGYRLIATVSNYYDQTDRHGKKWDLTTVFMRRDLA